MRWQWFCWGQFSPRWVAKRRRLNSIRTARAARLQAPVQQMARKPPIRRRDSRGKLSQPITNPIGRVTYVCPSTPTALEPLPLPAGLSVTVRLGEGIDSQPNDKGHRFSANVTAPVVWKGTTVVPAGAAALGTVTSAAPETLHDKQALGLHLNMVCFGGRAYALQADELVSASTDASGRSISGTFTGALPVGPASEDVIALPVESVLTFSTGATSVVKSQGVSRRENPQ